MRAHLRLNQKAVIGGIHMIKHNREIPLRNNNKKRVIENSRKIEFIDFDLLDYRIHVDTGSWTFVHVFGKSF